MTAPYDEADLEREGARAARAGRGWQANPFLKRENMPSVTGETLHAWARKHDAWQRGFERDGQDAERTMKQPLGAAALIHLVDDRLRTIPCVRAEMRDGPATLHVATPRGHERDHHGRNWDLDGFTCGALQASDCAREFRSTVDELRDRYDLA